MEIRATSPLLTVLGTALITVLGTVLGACAAPPEVGAPPRATDAGARSHAPLTSEELALALAAAEDVIADQGASVSNASVVARAGVVRASGTGHPCTSGRLLDLLLIGGFPHVVTTGHAVLPGEPAPDLTVTAMSVTLDAASGVPCLIGVRTAENGEPHPPAGATPLPVG